MNYILFEDTFTDNLAPITINHASFEVRCGAFTNIERVENLMESTDKLFLIVRQSLSSLIKERFPNHIVNPDILPSGLYLNGASIWDSKTIKKLNTESNFFYNGNLVAKSTQQSIKLTDFIDKINENTQKTVDIKVIHFNYLWDIINNQKEVLENDVNHFSTYSGQKIHNSVIRYNKNEIFIHDSAEVLAGTILDASKGPIIIDKNVSVDIGALVQGPVYLGKNSKINLGAKIRGNISLGSTCKVGGEIGDTVFQGYSNKQHDGFLGHSYIGEWVNLGANTNNSNLKNNYSHIRVKLARHLEVNSMQQFLGVFIGDFSKSGISTMFNSGTIVGLGANVFGSGFQDKFIESFSWGNDDKTNFDKFIITCNRIMSRRKCKLSDIELDFIKNIYNKTI